MVPGNSWTKDLEQSCAGLEGWACAQLSGLAKTHPQVDRRGGARGTSATQPLTFDIAVADVPEAIRGFQDMDFTEVNTRADGACALHAVFGDFHGNNLFLPEARKFFQRQLGDTAKDFLDNVGDDMLAQELMDDIWINAVQPGVLRRPCSDSEAAWIWRDIEEKPEVLQTVRDLVIEDRRAQKLSTEKRSAIVDAFGTLCVRALENSFLRPLLVMLDEEKNYDQIPAGIPDAPVGHTKLDIILSNHPMAQRYRSGIVECLGLAHMPASTLYVY